MPHVFYRMRHSYVNEGDKRMKKVIILIAIIPLIICTCSNNDMNRTTSILNKQWYLENGGDSSSISDSTEYKEYIDMKPNIDIGFKELQELTNKISSNNEVIVAIIDTGVDFNHESLKNAAWKNNNTQDAVNFIINDNNGSISPSDNTKLLNPHGTMCAGIIAGRKVKNGFQGIASMIDVKIRGFTSFSG